MWKALVVYPDAAYIGFFPCVQLSCYDTSGLRFSPPDLVRGRLRAGQNRLSQKLLEGFEGKLTSSKWATLAKCSQDTALRDILDLAKHGILTKDPAGGRSTSYSLIE